MIFAGNGIFTLGNLSAQLRTGIFGLPVAI